MAQHQVRISQLPQVDIHHKDLIVEVIADDEKLGELTVSQGGIGWFPTNAKQERSFSWEQFDQMVRDFRG